MGAADFYIETYLCKFTFRHYIVKILNIAEDKRIIKIKGIESNILKITEQKINENTYIIEGIIELDINYVINNIVKFYNTRINFNFIKELNGPGEDGSYFFPENYKLLIKANPRVFRNRLLSNNQVEVKIDILFRGCFKVFQDCSSLGKCIDIEVNCVPTFESYKEENLSTRSIPKYTQAFNIARKELITFFVKNKGDFSVYVQLEISPNGIDWTADAYEVEIPAAQAEPLVLATFLKFVRLKYYSINNSIIDIYLQTQG